MAARTSTFARFSGLILLFTTIVFSTPAFATGPSETGSLLVPHLLNARNRGRYPGFVPPNIWVYDKAGKAMPSSGSMGAYAVGQSVPLPEGWYQVEVGTSQIPQNRLKVFVKAGNTTVIPTGLIVVSVESTREQPRDVCNAWSGKLFVSLPLDPAPGPTIATNRTAGKHPVGAVQVAAGYYRIFWNGTYIATDIKPYHAYNVETGLIGPMPQNDYAIHRKKGLKSSNPGLRLCRNRATRVLSRSYWGTYNRQISAYPFKQRIWEQVMVAQPESKKGPYQKLKKLKIPGKIYTGPGSEPVAMWEEEELPATPPAAP